eukprot:gene9233-8307_t
MPRAAPDLYLPPGPSGIAVGGRAMSPPRSFLRENQ